jgi:hypothetical protein
MMFNQSRKPERYGAPDEAYSGLRHTLNQQKEKINHTVQDVHEDWKHPAFKLADKYKEVFTEGLKLYGEERAVQYWQSKRESFFKLYEQKIEAIENTLSSPILSYLSDESRDLTRKAAFEDPDKTLKFLGQLQASKEAEKEEKIRVAQPLQPPLQEKNRSSSLHSPQESSLSLEEKNKAFSSYFRFKELRIELEKDPYDRDLHKEMRKIGEYFLKNKEALDHIKTIDPEISKTLKQVAQERSRALERERGGLSL